MVELLVAEGTVGGVAGRQVLGLTHGRLPRPGFPAMVDVAVIGNAEEPGAEFGQAQEGAGGHVGTHQGVLGHVVGQGGITRAQGQQEPSQRLLLVPHQADEPFLGHATAPGTGPAFSLRPRSPGPAASCRRNRRQTGSHPRPAGWRRPAGANGRTSCRRRRNPDDTAG